MAPPFLLPKLDDGAEPIRLIICSKHRMLRAALRVLVETDDRINVIAEMDSVAAVPAFVEIEHPDIILLDEDLADTAPEVSWMALQLSVPTARLLLLYEGAARAFPRTLARFRGLRVVSKGDAPEALLDAIRRAHAGETLHYDSDANKSFRAAVRRTGESKQRMLKTGTSVRRRTISDKRVLAVLETVEDDLQKSDSIGTLAAKVGIGASRLRHLLRDLVGTSLSKFRTERRLQVAAHLLAYSHKRVSEIAYQVGFADLANFDKAFRKRFGLSPTRYRQSSSDRAVSHDAS
jgi:AraC-like DNA-binding protein